MPEVPRILERAIRSSSAPCPTAPMGRTLEWRMPSKRDVLAQLSRDELLAVENDTSWPSRIAGTRPARRRGGVVEEGDPGRDPAELSRDRLKELCRALGLDDAGREKAALVDRLTGASARARLPPTTTARRTAPHARRRRRADADRPPAGRASSPSTGWSATSGRRRTSCAGRSTPPTTRTSSSGCSS